MTLKNITLTQSDSWVVKQNRYSLIRSNYPSSTYLLDDHVHDSELHLRIPRAFSALENSSFFFKKRIYRIDHYHVDNLLYLVTMIFILYNSIKLLNLLYWISYTIISHSIIFVNNLFQLHKNQQFINHVYKLI